MRGPCGPFVCTITALAAFGAFGCVRPKPPRPPAWTAAEAGLEVAKLSRGGGVEVWAVRFDQARYRLALDWSASGLRVPGALAGYAAAINGGYFERDLRPSGLLIDEGRQVQAKSGGSGAVVIDQGRLRLAWLREAEAGPRASVLQAWPFLVEPGGADGIHRDDGKRSRRSAVGLDAAGRGLLIAVPVDGVTLRELMGICRELGAVVALNLDGGPSTGFALGVPPGWRSPSETEISNALVLRRREP